LNTYPLALDTWLTLGAASGDHKGVPKELDTDGSVLECPPYTDQQVLSAKDPGKDQGRPICIADGLQADTAIKEVINFKFDSGYLHKVRGNLLETTDGAWAVLGGMKGTTPENMVLIAQVTTTGKLHFKLNVQLGDPSHKPVKYVASDPQEGEVLFEGLNFGKYRDLAPR
jgi:hypothetical protein